MSSNNGNGNGNGNTKRDLVEETVLRKSVSDRNEFISGLLDLSEGAQEAQQAEDDPKAAAKKEIENVKDHQVNPVDVIAPKDVKEDLAYANSGMIGAHTVVSSNLTNSTKHDAAIVTKYVSDPEDTNTSTNNTTKNEPKASETTLPRTPRVEDRPSSQPGAVAVAPRTISTSTDPPPQQEENVSISSSSSSSGNEENDEGRPSFHVHATVVEEDNEQERALMEEEIRQRILNEAIKASVVGDDPAREQLQAEMEKGKQNNTRRNYMYLLALIIVIALAVGLGVGLSRNKDSNNSNENAEDSLVEDLGNISTLELVQKRGYIRCGISEFDFVKYVDNTTSSSSSSNDQNKPFKGPHMEGFNVEQCRAMAMLALGDPNLYELVLFDVYHRFEDLHEGRIDIMPDGSTHTMERDIWLSTPEASYSFTVPYFYSGLTFAGQPTFVDCVDALETFAGDCRDLRICLSEGSTHEDVLREILQGSVLVFGASESEQIQQYRNGECNVIAGENLFLGKLPSDITEGFQYSKQVVSKEPLAIVTRGTDPEWSDLANLIVNTWIIAEANNITQATASRMLELFGDKDEDVHQELKSQMVSLVATFGNHGELYQKHIQNQIPRDNGLNQPYDQTRTNGLLYSIPFGNLDEGGPDPIPSGKIQEIWERGTLNCGIQPNRGVGFAFESSLENETIAWTGFDVEFCRAVAAALFRGKTDRVTFVALDDESDGYTALLDNTVDMVAGARVSLQSDLREPSTGVGFDFTSPYYYDDEDVGGQSYALMSLEDDAQFSDFVYWIVMSLIYAEEQGIVSSTSVQMPVVTLFGEDLKQCFRDTIAAVGSYAELYDETLGSIIPREGSKNRLNDGEPGAQMYPVSPV